jgi:hypothetical protein
MAVWTVAAGSVAPLAVLPEVAASRAPVRVVLLG